MKNRWTHRRRSCVKTIIRKKNNRVQSVINRIFSHFAYFLKNHIVQTITKSHKLHNKFYPKTLTASSHLKWIEKLNYTLSSLLLSLLLILNKSILDENNYFN